MIANLLFITFRISRELFPSWMTNCRCLYLPGLLLFAENSVYFLFASLRASMNYFFSSSRISLILTGFLGGNLLMKLRSNSFWCSSFILFSSSFYLYASALFALSYSILSALSCSIEISRKSVLLILADFVIVLFCSRLRAS